MSERGMTVAINSDDADLARRLNLEAAKSVMYTGMEPKEALKMVTINPAKIIGIDSRVGSLETGKDADFVIWSGPPLSIYSKAEQTWIEGRRYFDLASDSLLRKSNEAEKQALIQKVLVENSGPNARGAHRGHGGSGQIPDSKTLSRTEARQAMKGGAR